MENVVDNNLFLGSKAYSFGHFVCYLSGDTAHVQHSGRASAQQRLLLVPTGNLHLHDFIVT